MSLAAGDTVEVIEKHENGWWFVCIEDEQGWAPSSYLESLEGSSSGEVEEIDVQGRGNIDTLSKADIFGEKISVHLNRDFRSIETHFLIDFTLSYNNNFFS